MTVRYRHQAGDTSLFSIQIAFRVDPDDGASATTEESLSWGGFQLWVDGQNLCAHLEEDEQVASSHWYLLGLFEWLVDNWDPLLHEERLPAQNDGADAWESMVQTRFPPRALEPAEAGRWEAEWSTWWQRHALQASREGGLFPDVYMRRWRQLVEISWGQTPLPGAPAGFRFLAPAGIHRLEPSHVAAPLYDVLRHAVDYLCADCPGSARLESLKERVDRLQTPDPSRRLAMMAGLGSSIDEMEGRWQNVRDALVQQDPARPEAALAALHVDPAPLVVQGACHASLMFGSVSPELSAQDVICLAGALVRQYDDSRAECELDDLRREINTAAIMGPAVSPWEQGYLLAEEVLDTLGLPDENQHAIDLDAILDQLGIVREAALLEDVNLRAAATDGDQHTPSIFVNDSFLGNQSSDVRRFTLAHELCHLLVDTTHGRQLAIVSGPWAPVELEKRANAFAAMLLMPLLLVSRAIATITDPLNTGNGVRKVAQQLKTSYSATLSHLTNLGYLDDATRERLIGEG